MQEYIAVVSDTQLHKRLYGLQESRQDWFDAFNSAINQIIERIDKISAIIFPGDILDQEEVGSHATYTVIDGLTKLAKYNVPILILLGNHDQPEDERINWVKTFKLVNKNVIEPSLDEPFLLEGNSSYKPIYFYGSHHRERKEIIPLVEKLEPIGDTKDSLHWLILHESLKELAPHPNAYEISVKNVPAFISKVILGDFHDFDIFTDDLNRQFIYPGSTETVSFNQSKTPGFILINRITNEITHLSTQQREYLTFKLDKVPVETWIEYVSKRIDESISKFKKNPVIRIFYPSQKWNELSILTETIKPKSLKIFTYDSTVEEKDDDIIIREARLPSSRDELIEIATEEIEHMKVHNKDDVIKILQDTSYIDQIQKEKFPNIQIKNESN